MNKKILITGYTTRMINSDRVQRDYITFSYVLPEILKSMGYEVEHRAVIVGEEIRYKYYYAFCGVAPLSSMTSGRICETHYVMDQMPTRYAVYADDWSFCGFGKSIAYALRDWEKFVQYKNFSYDSSVTDGVKESLRQMIAISPGVKGNNAPVLAPMFKWGDHEFLMRDNYCANLIAIDPSPWVKYPNVKIPPTFKRKKQWVMAALSNHSAWVNRQGFKLPVLYVGNKRMENCEVLSENQTIQLFADSFGILSVGYPSAGSGWWRTRYLNASWAETLVYSDPKDQVILGEAYRGTPSHFESLLFASSSYRETVEAQKNWLEKNIMLKDEVISIMERLLK